MKFYFLWMHPVSGINSKKPEIQQQLHQCMKDTYKEHKKFFKCLFFSAIVVVMSAIYSPNTNADSVVENNLKTASGNDKAEAVADRKKMNSWLHGNNFEANHNKVGDLKVGFDKYKFRIEYDNYRWLTIGAGYRGSGVWAQNSQNDYRDRYSNDNARIYVNGQVHRFVKFEFNTECFWCNNTHKGDSPKNLYTVLDAIGKFEYNRYFNIWGGRMLVPTERGELAGPLLSGHTRSFQNSFFLQ